MHQQCFIYIIILARFLNTFCAPFPRIRAARTWRWWLTFI